MIAFPENLSEAGFEVTLGVKLNGFRHGSMKLIIPLAVAVDTPANSDGL